MDGLGGALRELAREVQAPTPPDAAQLWQQGRARVRRRRTAATVIAAVTVLVVGYGAAGTPEPRSAMPAGAPHSPAIPKNLYEPNRFLAGVSGEGAPGRLAMIARKQGDSNGGGPWFGISATTGEYRYLDLPEIADHSTIRLSPDGTRLAYWMTGPTKEDKYPPPDDLNSGGPLPDKPVAGVAVYDTRDGSVVRHLIPSNYGLSDEDLSGLTWLGDDSLVFAYLRVTGSNTANDSRAYAWQLGRGDPVRLPGSDLEMAKYGPVSPGSTWLRWGFSGDDFTFREVDSAGSPTGRVVEIPEAWLNAFAERSGRFAATGGLGNANYDNVFVGTVAAAGRPTQLHRVGKVAAAHLLGWVSDSTVMVQAWPGELRDGVMAGKDFGAHANDRGFYAVNVDTGRTVRLGNVADNLSDVDVQVASSLLEQPMVHGLKPPSLFDVFQLPLGIAAVLVLAAAAWFGVRRRRRA